MVNWIWIPKVSFKGIIRLHVMSQHVVDNFLKLTNTVTCHMHFAGLIFRPMLSGSGPLDQLGPGPAAGLKLVCLFFCFADALLQIFGAKDFLELYGNLRFSQPPPPPPPPPPPVGKNPNFYQKFFLRAPLIHLSGPNGLCPSSYIYTAGDVRGWGSLPGGTFTSVDNSETCAGHCDANSNCCSFEYSPRTKNCNLNSECRPTYGVFEDYNFCVKGYFSGTSYVYICALCKCQKYSHYCFNLESDH